MGYLLEQKTGVTQNQHLMRTQEMQLAFKVLQLPVMELKWLLLQEIECNPLLEIQEVLQERFLYSNRDAFESSIPYRPTLLEHLKGQVREEFTLEEIPLVEVIIGNIDERGLMTTPPKEIAFYLGISEKKVYQLLKRVQRFDPPGIGACSIQESLLIQLDQGTLAFNIIHDHYEKLLKGKITSIAKKLRVSHQEILDAISDEIAPLHFHPIVSFSPKNPIPLEPDLTLFIDADQIRVSVNNETLPPLSINKEYLSIESSYVKKKLRDIKWLSQTLNRRERFLFKIGEVIREAQKEFFLKEEAPLVVMTLRELAVKLEVHESTITRAVANKSIQTPKGLFPLRYFFSQGINAHSSQSIKELIQRIIKNESTPLSDQEIKEKLFEKGYDLSRRTVAKYRGQLNIPSKSKRKKA
ncbi:RNA polymerase factor sigma-54 [Chlamydiales bacterium]|nr:RNA polymerase factor sigma-54 [Chlamydiales bacterium]